MLTYPAPERNKEPILEVLQSVLPAHGRVLEIASGTGQHVVHFAEMLPGLTWLPSDHEAQHREAISQRLHEAALANVEAPRDLDVLREPWPVDAADAIVCINMIHIAPWTAAQALAAGAARLLASGAPLLLYGPFRLDGRHTAPSNEAFDASLRERDASWGVRDLETVQELFARHGFAFDRRIQMPANNLCVVFRRAGASAL